MWWFWVIIDRCYNTHFTCGGFGLQLTEAIKHISYVVVLSQCWQMLSNTFHILRFWVIVGRCYKTHFTCGGFGSMLADAIKHILYCDCGSQFADAIKHISYVVVLGQCWQMLSNTFHILRFWVIVDRFYKTHFTCGGFGS